MAQLILTSPDRRRTSQGSIRAEASRKTPSLRACLSRPASRSCPTLQYQAGRPSGALEYDFVVLAPHAVYVLEAKEWYGRLTGDDTEWLTQRQYAQEVPAVARRP